MPTNQNVYNTRLTDETLEKRFRDTFRSQSGAELVDDLYASGVVVPVVDFTAAAQGSVLREDLQTAWDSSTGSNALAGTTYVTLISTSGFWQVDLIHTGFDQAASVNTAQLQIFDGSTGTNVWGRTCRAGSEVLSSAVESKFVVFLRAGDILRGKTQFSSDRLDIWYRQIADVSGNFQSPTGFTSS